MADIFLSYAREDKARAEQVAKGLAAAGLEVFWDSEIPPGQTWADYIEEKLTHCKALIVLWSEHSTKSQWVREEARMGRDKGVLIPVMIDGAQAPFGFGEVQAANLASWAGEEGHPDWTRFVAAVRSITNAPARPRPAPQPSAPRQQPAYAAPQQQQQGKKGLPVWAWVTGAVVATIVVLGIIGSLMPEQGAGGQSAQLDPDVRQLAEGGGAPAVNPGGGQQLTAADYQGQILQRLSEVEQAFASQGFQRIADPVTGQLPQAQHANWPLTLNTGGDYRIIGVCDNDCGDLDLILYDENNVLISQDQSTDATPVVAVAPQWSGPFTVQAVMYNCTVNPCYYALVLYGRPMQ